MSFSNFPFTCILSVCLPLNENRKSILILPSNLHSKTLLMKILILLFSLTFVVGHSQKLYEFDYIMEYHAMVYYKKPRKIKNKDHKVTEEFAKGYYLINSEQNEYFGVITEEDSLNYKIVLEDQKRGLFSRAIALKSELNDADMINMDCKGITRLASSLELQRLKKEDFDFVKLKDTTINNESFLHYKFYLKNPKERKRKRKKIGTYHLIIDKSSKFKLPLFRSRYQYEKWILNEKTPMGLIAEVFITDYEGKLVYSEKFIDFIETEKKIYLPKRCPTIEVIYE